MKSDGAPSSNFIQFLAKSDLNVKTMVMIELYATDIILFITMVAPYALYTRAYKAPITFKRILTQKQLILISSFMKFICTLIFAIYGFVGGFTFKYIHLSFVCIAIGQYLNYIVYTQLGSVRAYYGWELGLDNSPMVKGFPFNISHPQYKGCLLTLLGTFFLFTPTKRFVIFTFIWTICYIYMAVMESTKPGRKQ